MTHKTNWGKYLQQIKREQERLSQSEQDNFKSGSGGEGMQKEQIYKKRNMSSTS